MLKVLIADDELLVRTNIKMMLSWEQNDLVLCGEASNGLEVLDIMEKERPDIVLSDIRMPKMDGLQLSLAIKQNYPLTKVIILSNYNDFDYVKSALQNGAIDYILKHSLSQNTLLDAITRAKQSLLESSTYLSTNDSYEKKVHHNIVELKEKFITHIFSGYYKDEYEITKHLELLEIKLDIDNVLAIIMEIDEYKKLTLRSNLKDKSLMKFAIINIITEILNNYGNGTASHISDGRYVILLSFMNSHSEALINNSIHALLKQISLNIKKFVNISVSFGVGNVCSNIKNILQSYDMAEKALSYKFYSGKNCILKNVTKNDSKNQLAGLSLESEKRIILNIRTHQMHELILELEEVFKRIRIEKIDQSSSQIIFNDLLGVINRICREAGIELSKVYSDYHAPSRFMTDLETLEEIREWIISLFTKLMILTESEVTLKYSEYVKSTILFIKKHYNDKISLSDISDELKISSVYLGKIFKEEVGMGFNEYLTDIRLEKAKALLEEGKLSMREIISICGIDNYTYFFQIFKKKTGLTPKDFLRYKRT